MRRTGVGDRVALGVIAFLGIKLAGLLVNTVSFPTLRPAPAGRHRPRSEPMARVALLIPMRNEADRLPGTLPGLLAGGAAQLVFLDDESTDGSRRHRPARGGRPIPRGESERDRAGRCAATGRLDRKDLGVRPTGRPQRRRTAGLLRCGRPELGPGAITAVVEEMERQRADVFSVFPRERTVSWAERLLVPLIDDVVLCFLPFGLLRAPAPSAATACGALLAFRRAAYDTVGGFAAVRTELVEDVAIARLSRRRGLRLGLALGGDLLAVRMCVGYRGVIDGLGRGLTATAGGNRGLVIAGFAWHLAAYTLPIAAIGTSWWWRSAALLAVAERLLVEVKTGGRDWPAAAAVAASPVAALPVVARAMRRQQIWRGRVYG